MAEPATNTVTMPAAEAAELRQIRTLMDKAWKDKDKGAAFRRTLKAVDPTLTIPDEVGDEIAAPLNEKLTATEAQLKALQDRIDTSDRERAERNEERTLRTSLESAAKKYGLDDEGRQKVLERMAAMRSPDAEAAAAWVRDQLPKPEIVKEGGIGPAYGDIKSVFGQADGDDADLALLHSDNPMRYFDKVATKILNEPAEAAA
jgi:hypothetical protein